RKPSFSFSFPFASLVKPLPPGAFPDSAFCGDSAFSSGRLTRTCPRREKARQRLSTAHGTGCVVGKRSSARSDLRTPPRDEGRPGAWEWLPGCAVNGGISCRMPTDIGHTTALTSGERWRSHDYIIFERACQAVWKKKRAK